MSGIVFQFSDSPIRKSMTTKTVSASGTVGVLLSGTSGLMWRVTANPSNLNQVVLMTKDSGSDFWPIAAGGDTGWNPGNLMGYWYTGYSPTDRLHVWEMY